MLWISNIDVSSYSYIKMRRMIENVASCFFPRGNELVAKARHKLGAGSAYPFYTPMLGF